jgi:hypothetical protein
MEMYLQSEISKITKKKKLVSILKATEGKKRSWIRIRNLVELIHGSESVQKRHGSGTLPEMGVSELGRFRTRLKIRKLEPSQNIVTAKIKWKLVPEPEKEKIFLEAGMDSSEWEQKPSNAEKYQFKRKEIPIKRFGNLKEDFLDFFMYVIPHGFICRPSDSTMSEDAGIEPRTVRNLTVDLLYPGDVCGDSGARPPAHQDQRPVPVRVLNLSNLHHKNRNSEYRKRNISGVLVT